MDTDLCPHFTLSVYKVVKNRPGVIPCPRWFPIYDCGMASVMLTRLDTLEEGSEIVTALQTTEPDRAVHARCGPDLQELSPTTCTCERCAEYCLPGFVELMHSFGLDETFP